MRTLPLQDLVSVYRRTDDTRDAAGHPTAEPQLILQRMAEVLPMNASELVEAQQTVGSNTYRVRMRADPDTQAIRPSDRLRWRPRGWETDIEMEISGGPIPHGPRRRLVELIATEVV